MTDNSLTSLTIEVDRYLAELDALKYGDPAQQLDLARLAATHAEALGDFWRYARALVYEAWAYGFLNQTEASLTNAMAALTLARDYSMADIEALAVGVIAFNFLKCGILEEAAHLFEHQKRLGVQLGDDMLQAMALNDHAVVKMETQDFAAAAQLLQQAVVLMPATTHNGLDKSITHLNLAYASVKTRQFEDAIDHAEQVLAQVTDAPKIISDAHLWIAAAYLGYGDLDEARRRIAIARACVEDAAPPIYNDNVEQLTAELMVAEGRDADAAQIWEYMYRMALERQELDYAISALNNLKETYTRLDDSTGLISAYKRLSEDIPRQQKQNSDLRFAVLRMVFAMDKAALNAELRLSEQKNLILQRLSHEFRTPLAVIQTSAQVLDQYGANMTLEQRQERLQRITSQVQRMTVMLDDILEVMRLEDEGDLPLIAAPFQLEDLAQSAVRQLERYHVAHQRVQLNIEAQAAPAHGAHSALQSILVHLLTNALKFSKDAVTLHLGIDASNWLTLQVSDQGIGIPLEDQQTIFKPLVRGSNLDEVKGNGIGLAIVARLVRRLHGTIDIKSGAGTGTLVTVRVPLDEG